MKKLFDAANRYIETSDWKIIAVLKLCLISLGMMTGMLIKPQHRKQVFFSSLGVFIATYLPLMYKSTGCLQKYQDLYRPEDDHRMADFFSGLSAS